MIIIDGVTKKYNTGIDAAPVVKDVTLTLPNTGMCFILGKSGSGKSTLLNLLGGIISDYSGEIIVDGEKTSSFSEKQWNQFRNKYYGIVFQDFNLMEDQTVLDNLMLPLNILQKTKDEINQVIDDALRAVEMAEYKDQRVCRLSGGQKQRVAIARALVKNPVIMLADEPTGNLDSKTSEAIFSLLKKISKDCLIIVATHDVSAANAYADILLEIKDGVVSPRKDFNCVFDYRVLRNGETIGTGEGYSSSQLIEGLMETLKLQLEGERKREPVEIRIAHATKAVEAESISDQNHLLRQSQNNVMPLQWSKALRHAISNIKQKYLRNGLIILLNTILIVFLMFLVNLLNYKSALVLDAYNQAYVPKYLTVEKHYMYEDSFLQIQDATFSAGKEFYSSLNNTFSSDAICPEIRETFLRTDNYESHNVSLLVPQNIAYFSPFLLCGRLPQAENEIVVTDYLAYRCGIPIEPVNGRVWINDDYSLNVVGILKTDYQEYDILGKMARLQLSEYAYYKVNEEYNVAIVNRSYIASRQLAADSLNLPRSNLMFSRMESRLVNSDMVYGSAAAVTSQNLLCGTMPQSSNEIIISNDLAIAMEIDMEHFTPVFGEFINLYASEYNGTYSDSLNMYDYFPYGYQIVGVYFLQEEASFPKQVLVESNLFEEIKKEYYSSYIFNRHCILNMNISAEQFEKLFQDGVRWTDISAKKIYDFEAALRSLNSYLTLAMFLIIVGVITTCVLLISFSIKDRSRLLGIMKSIGYTRKDINSIFFSEAVIIGAMSVFTAIILFFCIKSAANNSYASTLYEYPFKILVFKPHYLYYVSLGCIVCCVLSGVFAIVLLLNQKPFELIHGN